MAGPWGQNRVVTLGRFVHHAVDVHGAEIDEDPDQYLGPDGPFRPRFLVKPLQGGGVLHISISDYDDDEILDWHTLDNFCRRLAIPSRYFGFWFDEGGNLHFTEDN